MARQALREVRDRQLGFRHYHDLIVSLSRNVLHEGSGAAGQQSGGSGTPFSSGQAWSLGLSLGGTTSAGNSSDGGVLGLGGSDGHAPSGQRAGDALGATASKSGAVRARAAQSRRRSPLATVLEPDLTVSRSARAGRAGRFQYVGDADMTETGPGGSRDDEGGGVLGGSSLARGRHGYARDLGKSEGDESDGRDDIHIFSSSSLARTSGTRSSLDSARRSGSTASGLVRRGGGGGMPKPGGASPLPSDGRRPRPMARAGGDRRPSPAPASVLPRTSREGVEAPYPESRRKDDPEILRALRRTAAARDRSSGSVGRTSGESGRSDRSGGVNAGDAGRATRVFDAPR